MKLFVVALFVGVCAAGRLEHTYLPPSSAQGAGGYDEHLAAPGGPSNQYLPPQQQYQNRQQYSAPKPAARQYLPPSSNRQYLPPSASGYSQGPATPPTPILKYENQPNAGDGSYNFEYETGNGIMQEEHGHQDGGDEEVVEGSYSYTGPDGVLYTVHYRADANGFQATGDHLPTPPPIPEAIQKSLALNAAAEARASQQGYQYSAPQSGYPSEQSRTYLPPQAGRGQQGYRY